MFYSAQTNGFYIPEIHGIQMPKDAVQITAEYHVALLEGQSQGKTILAGNNGLPTLQEPSNPTPEQIEAQIDAARLAAYQAEADPLFFKWQAGEATQAEWQAKREEIRQRFPKE